MRNYRNRGHWEERKGGEGGMTSGGRSVPPRSPLSPRYRHSPRYPPSPQSHQSPHFPYCTKHPIALVGKMRNYRNRGVREEWGERDGERGNEWRPNAISPTSPYLPAFLALPAFPALPTLPNFPDLPTLPTRPTVPNTQLG